MPAFRSQFVSYRGMVMARLIELIKLAFEQPTMPDEPHKDILPDTIRGIVSARSHGNVRLQEGLFYTKDDVDEQYQRVRKYDFAT